MREKGIIPPKPVEERPPSPPPTTSGPAIENMTDEEIDTLLEEDLDSDPILVKLRQDRFDELKSQQQLKNQFHYGSVYEISKPDYQHHVTNESLNTTVIVHMYHDSILSCQKINESMNELAQCYPSIKFVKILASRAVEHYPMKNLPTLLIYHHGDLQHNLVGLISMPEVMEGVIGLEKVLTRVNALQLDKRVQTPREYNTNDIDDDDEIVSTRHKSIFTRNEKKNSKNDSDSDDD